MSLTSELKEDFKHAVERNPWRVIAILASGMLGSFGISGFTIGQSYNDLSNTKDRIVVIEQKLDSVELTKQRLASVETKTDLALGILNRIEDKLDKKVDKR